jgi:predicted adenylyl cyclase CyaB
MKINLIELKARAPSLERKRTLLKSLGTEMEGTYHQTDTYFNAPNGRLKLREVEGQPTSKLIHYNRDDTPDPKQSDVTLYDTCDPRTLKTLLQTALGTKVTVTKTREIYHHLRTQIHLDKVENLGTYIEFEREIRSLPEDRRTLDLLMEALEIRQEDLETVSYSDLKMENGSSP